MIFNDKQKLKLANFEGKSRIFTYLTWFFPVNIQLKQSVIVSHFLQFWQLRRTVNYGKFLALVFE